MATELLLRYVHFICILTIAGTLAAEYALLKKTLTRSELNKLARIDALYGIAALVLVSAGLILWLGGVGKPAVFYSHNWVFHLKLTLFVTVGVLSVFPTVFFLKNRKGNPDETVTVPRRIFHFLRLEIALLMLIPLLAGLMSRGLGFYGQE